MSDSKKEMLITYEPDNSIRKGLWQLFVDIADELWKNRWLTYQFFKRNFSALYKQSVMGVLWVFVIPLFSVLTFVALNHSGVFQVGEIAAPYPLYASIGITFWQLFSVGVVASSNSIVDAGAMIKIINFSRKSIVIAATGRALVTFLIQMALVGFLFPLFHVMPHIGALWIPICLVPLLLLTLGFGFLFSFLNAVMRDVSNALSMLMTFLMFLTPVLYAKPKLGFLEVATHYNPLYYLVSFPRDLLLTKEPANLTGFLYSSLFALFVFIFSIIFFHLTEARLAERV